MINNEEKTFISSTTFLVTGGAGFIGSNIVRTLVDHGAKKVCVLDNLETGKLFSIQDLVEEGKIDFINGDIRDLETCNRACIGIDIVLHQAALGSVQRSIIDPITTNAVNVDGFINMLNAAKKNAVKKFIYASSSSVYGDDMTMPKKETIVGNLLSPYAVTKRTGEEYAKVFRRLYKLETIGLRYFNVFGPNQDINGSYAAVIPLFIQAMLAKKPVTIFGDGKNTRDFTFVDNVVLANIKAAISIKTDDNLPIYNMAFGGTTSLNDLHAILSNIMRNEIAPIYAPVREGDIRDSFADISRAKKELGFQPVVNLEDGLKRTVEWFSKNSSSILS